MIKRTKLLFVALILALVIAVISIAVLRESDLGTFQFENIENIDVTIRATAFREIDIRDESFVFLYFEYLVNNRNQEAVQFDPGAVRIKCNDMVNSETQYQSIASAITEPMPLPLGESTSFLYAVYSADLDHVAIESITLEDAGFSIPAFGTEGITQ